VPSAFLGCGGKKTAYKAIYYHRGKPQVVARAQQSEKMTHELKITKKLQGARGLLAVQGYGQHRKKGKKFTTLYSELYNSGNLKSALKKKRTFSSYEKMRIALGILQGLESMHRRGIVHRDLCAQNIFLNIPRGKPGRRKIKAVIADFGWANYAGQNSHQKAQANRKNAAPEALSYKKLKGSAYYATDIYAAGMILYHLFYKKPVSWKESHAPNGLDALHDKLIHKINQKTQSKRNDLAERHSHGPLPTKEKFEYLILRMIDPNPKKRGSASKLRRQMQHIVRIAWFNR